MFTFVLIKLNGNNKMEKIFLTLTVMMLSVFTLCAIPNSKEQIGLDNLMESYTASNDSVIVRDAPSAATSTAVNL